MDARLYHSDLKNANSSVCLSDTGIYKVTSWLNYMAGEELGDAGSKDLVTNNEFFSRPRNAEEEGIGIELSVT